MRFDVKEYLTDAYFEMPQEMKENAPGNHKGEGEII
jgi:hypothetical protein